MYVCLHRGQRPVATLGSSIVVLPPLSAALDPLDAIAGFQIDVKVCCQPMGVTAVANQSIAPDPSPPLPSWTRGEHYGSQPKTHLALCLIE